MNVHLITSKECFDKYGDPKLEKNMVKYSIPVNIKPKCFPKTIYCNKDLVAPLEKALSNCMKRNLLGKITSFDGCFNIRQKKGNDTYSLHSWGIALDINATSNGYGAKPQLDRQVVACFEEAGFHWGGYWKIPDGMHFQLSKLP